MVGELLVKPLAFSQLTILFVFEGANVSVCPSPDISEQRLYERVDYTVQSTRGLFTFVPQWCGNLHRSSGPDGLKWEPLLRCLQKIFSNQNTV